MHDVNDIAPGNERHFSKSARGVIVLILVICAVGILARTWDLGRRSIWADEAWVALKVSQVSVADVLIDKSDRHYSYPPFFGVTVHLFTVVFGKGEAALRLFPAICGILSMILIYLIALKAVGRFGSVVAMAFLSFSYWGMLYSKELKQYSSDMFFALLLIYLTQWLIKHRDSKRWVLFGACCSIGFWFSQTMLFLLPGVLLAALFTEWKAKSNKGIILSIAVGLLSLISFGINYAFFIKNQRHTGLAEYWENYFADTGSISAFAAWSIKAFTGLFTYFFTPAGAWIVIPLVLIGVAFWLKRIPIAALIIFTPAILAYIAGILGQYPFGGSRTSLFLMPLLMLAAAAGGQALFDLLDKKARIVLLVSASILLAIWAGPMVKGAFLEPVELEESRPVIEYIQSRLNPGDTLYVYPYGKDVFDYYYKGDRKIVIMGEPSRDKPQGYYSQIDRLIKKGGGYWLFFTHFRAGKQNELEVIYKYAAKLCKITDGIQKTDAAAFYMMCDKIGEQPVAETGIEK